jgi:hypothetical protein
MMKGGRRASSADLDPYSRRDKVCGAEETARDRARGGGDPVEYQTPRCGVQAKVGGRGERASERAIPSGDRALCPD